MFLIQDVAALNIRTQSCLHVRIHVQIHGNYTRGWWMKTSGIKRQVTSGYFTWTARIPEPIKPDQGCDPCEQLSPLATTLMVPRNKRSYIVFVNLQSASCKTSNSEALSAWQPRGNKNVFRQRKDESGSPVRLYTAYSGGAVAVLGFCVWGG